IVHLKRETTIDRGRTAQRNFISHYLKDRGEKEAGLVAFVSPDEEDWRFSFVKMEYKFEKTPKGDVKVKEKFTPARRYSFLVGKNESSHTAQSCFVDILINDTHNLKLNEIGETFNIEKVTKEFYEKYRNLFFQVKDALDKVVKKDEEIRKEFQEKGINTVDFSKKLLGQIVFLYFLQKKGWFGVKKGQKWGSGSKHFLRELFEKKHCDYKNFFNNVLEPLFYEALRNDRSYDDHYFSYFNCKIPFLNGGLFDPLNDYNWAKTDILLPNTLFSNQIKTKEGDIGTGILDFFDRYNFTVKEDEPLEKEVAIDPELLGKIYEKFNAIHSDNYEEYKKALKSKRKGEENKFNKKYGVYYTPREIVHYMCQQSLINYLYTEFKETIIIYQQIGNDQMNAFGNEAEFGQMNLNVEHKSNLGVTKEDIETLVKFGDHVRENEASVEAKGRETRDYTFKLSESIRQKAELIDKKLANITICDPAVGSGAFPVGMMSEIIKARNVLSVFIKNPERTIYNFKRHCIEKSIYGVDIDPGAVEIAKLRLWLSLIVDEEDIKQIKPLPNLEYKIVCGDSLLGYPYTPRGLEKIEQLKLQFFNETRPLEKNKLKEQVDDSIYSLFKNTNRSLGYKVNFDFKINFSEVFRKKGGFDVVIANPPYINIKRGIETSLKNSYKKIYKSAQGQFDLFTIFIEKGTELTKNGITYIIPKPFINNENYKIVRELVLNSGLYEIVIGSGVFEEANVESCLFFASKKFYSKKVLIMDFDKGKFKKHNLIEKHVYTKLPFKMINTEINSKDIKIFEKMNKKFVKLGEIINITRGVECGKNDKIITKQKTSFKLLRGEDVKKYLINYKNIFIKFSEKDPQKFKFSSLYCSNKILIRRVSKDLICTMDDNKFVVLNTLYCCIPKSNHTLSYITAILNSKLISYWFKKMFVLTDKLFPYVRKSQLNFIPIKDIGQNEQKPFTNLVDRILIITKDEDYLFNSEKKSKVHEYERQIDQLAYKLYGLTEEEIKIVEKEKYNEDKKN
ncbi:MAG TPA: TaqI-like C-terminal specificity domain-containing protein, partial [Candidatus Paceibacterota bacterium]|nr:TaqI-like C-terminal specificity domain-containing protein [Candidatus Paceibacterota bacterium]